jgi:hypothetical protein
MRRLRPLFAKGIESLTEITRIESHPQATRSDEGGSAPASALTKAGEQSLGLPRPPKTPVAPQAGQGTRKEQ